MSDIRAGTISDAAGTGPITMTKQSPAKAWVNFNGETVTSSNDMTGVRDSFNVSGIVDNSAGNYTVYYSNNMLNNGYSPSGWANGSGYANAFATGGGIPATSSIIVRSNNSAFDATDSNVVCLSVNGDLA